VCHQGDGGQARVAPGQDTDQIGEFHAGGRTAFALQPAHGRGREGPGLGRGLEAQRRHPLQQQGADPRMVGRADRMGPLRDRTDIGHGALGGECRGRGTGPDGCRNLQGQHGNQQRCRQ
jgi:hypothetical protein